MATHSHEDASMSETFTKGMARNIYFGGSLFFFLLFLEELSELGDSLEVSSLDE